MAHAEDFIVWYDQTQESFLTALAEYNGINPEQMLEQYDDYCIFIEGEAGESLDNCDLSRIDGSMAHYILAAKDNLSVSKFSRIRDVARWLAENNA